MTKKEEIAIFQKPIFIDNKDFLLSLQKELKAQKELEGYFREEEKKGQI